MPAGCEVCKHFINKDGYYNTICLHCSRFYVNSKSLPDKFEKEDCLMSYTDDCCEKCKYFRKLKHNFMQDYGFEESFCCVVWEYYKDPLDDDGAAWIQEVGPDGMCELFCSKEI